MVDTVSILILYNINNALNKKRAEYNMEYFRNKRFRNDRNTEYIQRNSLYKTQEKHGNSDAEKQTTEPTA